MITVAIKDEGLVKLMEALGNLPTIRIGVLGQGARADGKKTNAEVLAAHEYGSAHNPIRSVLRVPLTDHLEEYLEKAGAFSQKTFQRVLETGSFREYGQKIAITAELVVQDAFDTGGFGKWAPLTQKTMSRKKVKQILVETQQLKASISSEVKD